MNSKITGRYNENITGVRVVKALNREQANLESFGHLTGEMYQAGYRAAWLSALFLPTVQLISALAIACIVVYSGLGAGTGDITYGGIQAFVSYVVFMVWPVQEMARVFAEMQQAVASADAGLPVECCELARVGHQLVAGHGRARQVLVVVGIEQVVGRGGRGRRLEQHGDPRGDQWTEQPADQPRSTAVPAGRRFSMQAARTPGVPGCGLQESASR